MQLTLGKIVPSSTLLVLLSLASGSFASPDTQYIVLEDENGEPFESDSRYQIDLSATDQPWNNRAVKACGNGIWLLHDGVWSGETELVKLRDNNCVTLGATAGKVTSLRAVGMHGHKDVTTLNSFAETNYTGKMIKFTKDNMKPTGIMASIIIIGPESWTVFWNDDKGHTGSRCLLPVMVDYSDTTEAPDCSVKPYFIPKMPIVKVYRGCKRTARSIREVARVLPAEESRYVAVGHSEVESS